MSQYRPMVSAVLGHDLRAVLAHSDAVAVAPDGEMKAAVIFKLERCGAERKQAPELRPRPADAAQNAAGPVPALVAGKLAHPPRRGAGEGRFGGRGARRGAADEEWNAANTASPS